MIYVSELMDDPDFATQYKVHRSTGKWQDGRFVITKDKTLDFYGPVQSADNDDLEQFSEGDRQKGIMKFFCSPPNEIFITADEGEPDENDEIIVSDVVEYEKKLYKIIRAAPWKRNGYIRAFGYKIGVITKNGGNNKKHRGN